MAQPVISTKSSSTVKKLFFPFQYISKGEFVYNSLILSNENGGDVRFKVKTTHPQGLDARPKGGVLPAGSAIEVMVMWNKDLLITDPTGYSDLKPPKQPKLHVEQKFVDESKGSLPTLRCHVTFEEPGPDDEFHVVIGQKVYSSNEFNEPLSDAVTSRDSGRFWSARGARDLLDEEIQRQKVDKEKRQASSQKKQEDWETMSFETLEDREKTRESLRDLKAHIQSEDAGSVSKASSVDATSVTGGDQQEEARAEEKTCNVDCVVQ